MRIVDLVTTGGVAGDATAVELQSTTASPTTDGARYATRAGHAATATHQQRKNAA
jgi:hypothetical protein